MPDAPPQTFDDLQRAAQARWIEIAQLRAERAAALASDLANSTDVAHAPTLGTLWSHPGIICTCGSFAFVMQRWACVNGVRSRTELQCARCGTIHTWDWPSMTFVESHAGPASVSTP